MKSSSFNGQRYSFCILAGIYPRGVFGTCTTFLFVFEKNTCKNSFFFHKLLAVFQPNALELTWQASYDIFLTSTYIDIASAVSLDHSPVEKKMLNPIQKASGKKSRAPPTYQQ